MEGFELIHVHEWYPLAFLGLTSPWFSVNAETVLFTWLVMGIMIVLALIGRWALRKPHSVMGYVARSYITAFRSMVGQSCNRVVYRYFLFITTLFTFIFLCNIIIVIPGTEEPTIDLNTTFALALITLLYVQAETLRAHGLKGFLQEYFKMPLTVVPERYTLFSIIFSFIKLGANIIIALALLPLEILGKLATVISLSFRLFGNIFGGAIIAGLWKGLIVRSVFLQIIGLLGLNLLILLFFGLFEGFIQALVFSILSLTYICMATQQPAEGH